MTIKPDLIILDIGSHKLEELQTLLSPFPRQLYIYIFWLIKQLVKFVIWRDPIILSNLRKQVNVVRYYFLSSRRYNLTIISIEPNPSVALSHVARLAKKYKTVFLPVAVLGHDTDMSSDLKVLYSYDHSISSSLYRKDRAIQTAGTSVCVSLRLSVIWNGLLREGIVSTESKVILRMNCEGAELGVLRDCEEAGLHVKCVIGSIGDVEKIHGRESGNAAKHIMKKLDVEYHYFKGDDPSTWHDIAAVWDANTAGFELRS
jgi:hypothetical protein